MARALLQHVVMDADGTVQASKAVTFFEDDGTTPYGASIYDVSSGGAPVLSHTTNSEGLIRRYVDPADARRVKLTVAGAATQTQSQFDLDPATVTTLTGTQTLTNKTLTSPTINGGTVNTATLDDPTVTGVLLGGKLRDKGGMIVNVKAYETTEDTVGVNSNSTHDTVAIEAAIADAKAQSVTQYGLFGEGRLMQIHCPAGRYNLIRPIDLDGLTGCSFSGDGMEATVFGIATGSGANTAAYWSTRSMMSAVGTNFCRYEGFSLTPANGAAAPIPECGLLMASNDAFTSWLGSAIPANISNRNEVYNVRVRGAFTKGAHVNYAMVSSIYQACEFARDKSLNAAYPNGTTIDQAALILTRDNSVGVSQSGSVGLLAVGAGASCSDLSFTDVEVHDFCQGSPSATSCTCPAVWLDECYDVAFWGGNWLSAARGSTNCGYLRLSMGLTAGGSLTGCRNITIENIHWYVEGGLDEPDVGLRVTGNAANDAHVLRSRVESYPANDTDEINHPGPAIIASDIVIRNCRVNLQFGASFINGGTAAAGGSTAANFLRWKVQNVQLMDSNTHLNQANMIAFSGSDTGLFDSCEIECSGNALVGNGSTISRSKLTQPGAITGMTITHGDFEISGGGALSLGAGGAGYYGLGSASATRTAVVPVRVPHGCRVFNLRVVTGTAPGGATSLSFTLQKATPSTTLTFAATALTGTIATTSTTGANTANFVEVNAGDILLLEVSSPVGAATTEWLAWTLSAFPEV